MMYATVKKFGVSFLKFILLRLHLFDQNRANSNIFKYYYNFFS